jgi:uncharacterized protein YdaT
MRDTLEIYFNKIIMPYTKNDYPNSLKNLPTEIREKAIDILNRLLEDKEMDESIAIPTSISRAKDWASNRGEPISETDTDKKAHGRDIYISPHEEGWSVKEEKASKASFVFDKKDDAVDKGREMAKKGNNNLIIHRKNGSIQKKLSYNR